MEKREGITRIEVIDKEGRSYVKWDCEVTESVQDNGRTLKIFVGEIACDKCIKSYGLNEEIIRKQGIGEKCYWCNSIKQKNSEVER